ncbi:MAG TPA: DNRLRE domain-containing protein, partial [Lacipirellulaceae bacterium]|nr:DNRLRE domain-containing protein [Lacipirellulaceae bacterium]
LAPSKDNTLVQQTNPAAQTSGGQGDIFVGRTGQDGQNPPVVSIRRGLIAFDVAGAVPAGSTVTAVSLTLRETMGNNGDQSVALHRVSQDWGEGASTAIGAAAHGDATWLYTSLIVAAPLTSPAWTVPGGAFAAAASAALLVTDDNGAGQLFTWSSAANPLMLADVQQWVDSPASNFGWALIGNEAAGNTAKRFNGGEAAVAPVLTIEYVIPEPGAALLAALGVLALGSAHRKSPSVAGRG